MDKKQKPQKKWNEFAYTIPNLKINGEPAPYPVLNERAVRAGAGLMLLVIIFTYIYGAILGHTYVIKITVIVFFIDFIIRILFGPKPFSIFGTLGSFLVSNQKPEWVGAVQKRFAWTLGAIMAGTMIIVYILLGIRGWPPFAICGTCFVLMWMEAVLGLCVGCKIYDKLIAWGVFKMPEYKPACPGGVCSIKKK